MWSLKQNHNIFQLNLNEKVSKQSVVFKSAHNYTITKRSVTFTIKDLQLFDDELLDSIGLVG